MEQGDGTTSTRSTRPLRTVEDLRALMGPGHARADAVALWRLLDERGLLVVADHGVVVAEMGDAEWRAWCARARVAARRSRSALAGPAPSWRPPTFSACR